MNKLKTIIIFLLVPKTKISLMTPSNFMIRGVLATYYGILIKIQYTYSI